MPELTFDEFVGTKPKELSFEEFAEEKPPAPPPSVAPTAGLRGPGWRVVGGKLPIGPNASPDLRNRLNARTKEEWMWNAADNAAREGGTFDDAWKDVMDNGYVVGDLEDDDLNRIKSMYSLARAVNSIRGEAFAATEADDELRAASDPSYWSNPDTYDRKHNYRATQAFQNIAKMSPEAADVAASLLEEKDGAMDRLLAARLRTDIARDMINTMLPENKTLRSMGIGFWQWGADVESLIVRGFSTDVADRILGAADALDASAPEGRFQSMVRGAARSIPTTAAGGLVGGLPGFGVAVGGAGATEMNQAVREGRLAGLEGWELAGYVASAGTVEMGSEALFYFTGFGGIEKLIGKGLRKSLSGRFRDILKTVGIATFQEIPQEIATEIGHNVRRVVFGTDPEALSPESVAETVIQTAGQTLLTTLAVSSPAAIANTIQQRQSIRLKKDMARVAEEYETLTRISDEAVAPATEGVVEGKQEIASAAIRSPSGEVFTGVTHLHALAKARNPGLAKGISNLSDEKATISDEEARGLGVDESGEYDKSLEGWELDGFVTKDGAYLTREEASPDAPIFAEDLNLTEPAPAPTEGETEATRKQKAQAHIIAKEEAVTESAYRKLAVTTTGKSSMADMTKPEAKAFIIALQKSDVNVFDELTDAERTPLEDVSGDGYMGLVEYANDQGAVPAEPQARNDYLSNLLRVGRKMGKHAFKLGEGQEPNALNHWSAARYAMLEFEERTGIPVHRTYTEVVHSGSQAVADAAQDFEDKLASIGKTIRGLSLRKQNNEAITAYLFEEDSTKRKALFDALDEDSKKIATAMQEFLADESARAKREARWRIWEAADKNIQPQIDAITEQLGEIENKASKKATELQEDIGALKSRLRRSVPKNAPESALEEGRKAQAEGTLEEWIAGQTWGTRKNYFMSESQRADLTDLMEGSVPEDIAKPAKKPGRAPKAPVTGVQTREGKADRLRGESVLGAVLRHYTMARVFNATFDGTQELWANFARANPSARDITDMRNFVDSALGRPKAASPTAKVVRSFNRAFWRFHFISPTKSAWFFLRNIGQNVAYSASQLNPLNMAAAAKNLLAKKAPGLSEAFQRVFSIRVSQKRQMQQQFLLIEEGKAGEHFGNRAGIIIDMVGVAPGLSDEINRGLIWPVLYQSAYDNASAYLKGEISFNSLSRGLRLGSFPSSLQIELHQLLAKGKLNQFVEIYAESKVENIHFRYETALRSAAEQTVGGRLTVGLIAFPRGVYEILTRNGIRPFLSGIQDGNYNRAYQGLVTILSLMAGSWLAERLIKLITGKGAYDLWDTIVRYTPLAPGAAKAKELFDDVGSVWYRAEKNDWPVQKTADRLIAVSSKQLDMFLPLADVYINYYETQNNKYGVDVWTLVKAKITGKSKGKTRKLFKTNKRDSVEAWQHMIFGGAEGPEKK